LPVSSQLLRPAEMTIGSSDRERSFLEAHVGHLPERPTLKSDHTSLPRRPVRINTLWYISSSCLAAHRTPPPTNR
ncbi:hypothetical protein BV898_09716, partial [Hypsibius exemplaris]